MSEAPIQKVAEETTPSTHAGKPRRFGRYTLLQKIGHGGMATLFLGRLDGPEGFEKFMAIKKIHPHLAEERQFVRMFLDEARLAARIQHPNVVQIFELGEVGGEYFFAMEYLMGDSLGAMMKKAAKAKLCPRLLMAHIVARAADGLHAAHELRGPDGELVGVVHRDVSPQNIFVGFDGVVKVVDFGIAKAAGRLQVTETGQLKGKYAYMSPEQILGRGVDRRADVFALGVVLYESTTLRRLFKGENQLHTLDNVLRHNVPRPTAQDPSYPPPLEAIVMKALAKNPGERYSSCAELANQLDIFVASTGQPTNPAAVSTWMREHFAQELDVKQRMLQVGRTIPTPPPEEEKEEEAKKPARRGLAIGIGVTLAILLSLGITVAAMYFLNQPPPVPNVGSVSIATTPPGAKVYIDDEETPIGQTPLEYGPLKMGSHPIKVVAKGYKVRESAFVIQSPGQRVSLELALERIGKNLGVLKVAPAKSLDGKVLKQAVLTLDGKKQSKSLPSSFELPPGAHKIKVAAKGFRTFEQAASLQAGSTIEMLPILVPEQATPPPVEPGPPIKRRPVPQFGYLTLQTNPWSIAFAGGRRLGQTPVVKAKLPAKTYRIRLLPNGQEPAKYTTVRIDPNQTVRRSINLN